jgi:hypothetical protein
MRTPVASMNVTRSDRSASTACSSAARLLFRRVTSSVVRALGGFLGLVFDGVDFAGGVDGEGAVADGEVHGARDDGTAGSGGRCAGVVLDVSQDGVEALGGGFADVELADGWTDVVLEGAPVGSERGR